MLLSPHLVTILDALKFKSSFDHFTSESFCSNFELLLRKIKISDYQISKVTENVEDRSLAKLIFRLFHEVSCFGLRLQFYSKEHAKPIKIVYLPTLSLLNVKRGDRLYDYSFCQ